MVTRNAGDSRSGENNNRNSGGRKEYKGNFSSGKKEYKTSNNRNNDSKTPNNNRNNDFKTSNNRNNDFKRKDYKPGYGNPYNKDKDGSDYKNSRDNRSKAVSNKDSKTKEQQVGKIDIINRLEKEKKAVQKKKVENNRKGNKNIKPQLKPKRVNNIDWTKEYENDSYDDDDLDIYL